MSTRGIIILLAFSFVLFIASLYGIMRMDPGSKPKASEAVSSYEVPIGGDFQLVDTNGNIVTQNNLNGKLTMVYFGYGHCPDVCPAMLHNLTTALNKLQPTDLDKVQVFFITLDPQRDTAEYLKQFMSGFHPKIIALNGSADEIEKVSKEYKVYVTKNIVSEQVKDDYLLDHTSLTYLMGKDGKYILHFATTTTPDEIVLELKKHLD